MTFPQFITNLKPIVFNIINNDFLSQPFRNIKKNAVFFLPRSVALGVLLLELPRKVKRRFQFILSFANARDYMRKGHFIPVAKNSLYKTPQLERNFDIYKEFTQSFSNIMCNFF